MADSLFKLGLLSIMCWMAASCESTFDGKPEDPFEKAAVVPGNAEVIEKEAPDPLPTFQDPGGDLGLRELSHMALGNSPLFAEAEGNLRVAKAKRKIVGEWQDPQLRTGFDWDDVRVQDNKVPGPDDSVRRNEQFGAGVRFYPPNPFAIRAEMDKAMAEISYAEFYLKQVGRELINETRRLYQELQFLQENISQGKGLIRLEKEEYQRLLEDFKANPGDRYRTSMDKQRLSAENKRGLTSSAEIQFQKVRAQLASLVGLGDARRISVSGVPNRPIVGFRDDTVGALTEMAFINNLKLGDLKRLEDLARGDLKEFKAQRIPWVSFLEAGRDRTFSDHLAINDTWSVRLAIDMPIFTLFSKEGEIYQEQIRSYQKQADRYRKQIERRIESAVANIRETREGLSRFDRETSEIISDLQKIEAEFTAMPQMQAEVLHQRRTRGLGRSRDRLKAEQSYHDTLLDLEEIIRDDIEAVFREKGN
ncbi:MAG: outer membrane protein TolC [Verrucomicrobiales bacterium]|jgi:outer membrane protein TolC